MYVFCVSVVVVLTKENKQARNKKHLLFLMDAEMTTTM